MALEDNVTEADGAFVGKKIDLVYTIYPPGTMPRDIADGTAIPQDVTGWALEYVQRLRAGDAAAVITKTTGSGIVLTDPMSGVVTVSLTRADSVDLAPRTHHDALARTDTGNEVLLQQGTFAWRKGASH